MTEREEANIIGLDGQKMVENKLREMGYKVEDVSRARKHHCDLIVEDKEGNKKKIEVKATKSKVFALPDMHGNQVIEEDNKPVSIYADEVWVVVNMRREPKFFVITKEKFEEFLKEKPEAMKKEIRWNTNDNIIKDYAKERK